MIPATVTTCNTCKAAFPGTDKLRDHYRGEWHAFNSRRRAGGLAPVSLKEYAGIAAASKPAVRPVQKKASEPPITKAMIAEKMLSNDVPDLEPVTSDMIAEAAKGQSSAVTAKKDTDPKSSNNEDTEPSDDEEDDGGEEGDWTDASEDDNDEEEEGEEGAVKKRRSSKAPAFTVRIGPNISIFDNKIFKRIEDCVSYMELKFGFYIPDKEYVSDLPGLLTYLSEKVKLGGVCLFCEQQFSQCQACQNHMIDKMHCKLPALDSDDNDAADELEDFYDYSNMETFSDEEDGELNFTAIGELILPNNKVVGNRAYWKYYKQHFRAPDMRTSVLAVKREEIAKLGLHFRGLRMDERHLMKLSDLEVSSMLMKQQREAMKYTKIQQRAQQKYHYKVQQSEYQSTVDKLRSSATTTEKIRDWHRRL